MYYFNVQRYINTFITRENALGRHWAPGTHGGSNELFFSGEQESNPAGRYPHLHLSYDYFGYLTYLGCTIRNGEHIVLFYNGWLEQNFNNIPYYMNEARQGVKDFWP